MVQATRWRQDSVLLPTNPYQRVRFAPTFPSGSGNADSAFGWSPIPIDGAITRGGSPNGFSPYSGLSGMFGGPLDTSGIIKGLAAVAGIALGYVLAKKNLGY